MQKRNQASQQWSSLASRQKGIQADKIGWRLRRYLEVKMRINIGIDITKRARKNIEVAPETTLKDIGLENHLKGAIIRKNKRGLSKKWSRMKVAILWREGEPEGWSRTPGRSLAGKKKMKKRQIWDRKNMIGDWGEIYKHRWMKTIDQEKGHTHAVTLIKGTTIAATLEEMRRDTATVQDKERKN